MRPWVSNCCACFSNGFQTYGALTELRRDVIKGNSGQPSWEVRTRTADLAAEAQALGLVTVPPQGLPTQCACSPAAGSGTWPLVARSWQGDAVGQLARNTRSADSMDCARGFSGFGFPWCFGILLILSRNSVGRLLPERKHSKHIHTIPVSCLSFHVLRSC